MHPAGFPATPLVEVPIWRVFIGNGMLAPNQIYLMDCLEGMKAIPDKSIDMILCDLPYGVSICEWDKRLPLDKLWQQYERIIKANGAIVLTAVQPFTSVLISSNYKLFKYCWVWQKSNVGNVFNCKNAPQKDYEDIAVFSKASIANGARTMMQYYPQGLKELNKVRSNKRGLENGVLRARPCRKTAYIQNYTNYPRQVLYFKSERGHHPTQKPLSLFEYLIKTYTNEGETVLDNCIGSGTTALACINTNRNYIGFETEQKYIDIANQRINALQAAA